MIRIFRQYISPRQTLFVTGEGLLIFSSVALASLLLLRHEAGIIDLLEANWPKILIITLTTQISLYFNDLYDFKNSDNVLDLASRLLQSIGIASIVLAIVYFLRPDMIIGRWIFFASIILLILFVSSWRVLYSLVIRKKLFAEKALILGMGELARNLFEEIRKRKDLSYNVCSVVADLKDKDNPVDFLGSSIYYGFENLCDVALEEKIGTVIVALDEKRGVMPYRELLNCKVRGLKIIDGESFYERVSGKLLVEKLNPSWLIFSEGFDKSKSTRFLKRVADLVLSTLLLIVTSPIILLVAIAIKLDSPGPVIFSQERVGESRKIFTLRKFRSMRADAERESGPVWATENDSRVTRVGKIIRKLRIDELPQLWNVFAGEMSFVGPRPERPFFVEQLRNTVPYYDERFSVKPGVSGWAQIKYPYGASEEDALEKLKYDLYYIKNLSVLMDLVVIFTTVKIVLLGRGSR
jgi:sugar transferase (PEP-CTERM system associated)